MLNDALAQCNGAFGDVVAGTDFGKATNANEIYGDPLNPLNTGAYGFVKGQPGDGYYTIATSTSAMQHVRDGNWHLVNSRGNDNKGYMMVINADLTPGIFYQEVKQDLCPNTTYRLSAYVINLLKVAGGNPKLTFIIEDAETNAELKSEDVPEIEKTTNPEWVERIITFKTTASVRSIRIKIRNNSPGGQGNDLALDDITFRACGPQITPSINNTTTSGTDFCVNENKTFTLSATVDPGVYNNPGFQWQKYENDTWINISGQTTNQTIVPFINAAPGIYKYRMLVAEQENINSITCRTVSPEFIITANALPNPIATGTELVCLNEQIRLYVNEPGTYKWTNPAGTLISEDQSHTIDNATYGMSGVYTVEVTNAAGCKATTSITINVIPPVTANITPILPICEGTQVTLQARGGTIFKWTPSTGLSATDIPNPIASPLVSTTYTVNVSNGACETSASIDVVVLKPPTVSAGDDKKIREGQSTVLNGSFTGDRVGLRWIPAEGLDNPLVANPVASPKTDMTYTLIASSPCGTVSDQVFVRVYQKIVVPNTFSPNGDGINDLWQMDAVTTYPNANVKVMNRHGETVFESSGYQKPWDGKYKNADLPVGVYYYIINLQEGQKSLSGSVTILR